MNGLKPTSEKVHTFITYFTKTTLTIGVLLALYHGRYQAAVETAIILFITFLPLVLGRRFQIKIPAEFELLAIVFIYATLFLGEVHGYYIRYWWWDLVLHTSAGLLLGILGFLLVYVLNEKEDIDLDLTPGFMALFSFVFAMAFGAIWEIFEYSMDSLFGLDMQKSMFDDPSGLTDTMWDLIVDAAGALVISILGYGYFRATETSSFLEQWIDDFIENNPRLFRKREE